MKTRKLRARNPVKSSNGNYCNLLDAAQARLCLLLCKELTAQAAFKKCYYYALVPKLAKKLFRLFDPDVRLGLKVDKRAVVTFPSSTGAFFTCDKFLQTTVLSVLVHKPFAGVCIRRSTNILRMYCIVLEQEGNGHKVPSNNIFHAVHLTCLIANWFDTILHLVDVPALVDSVFGLARQQRG